MNRVVFLDLAQRFRLQTNITLETLETAGDTFSKLYYVLDDVPWLSYVSTSVDGSFILKIQGFSIFIKGKVATYSLDEERDMQIDSKMYLKLAKLLQKSVDY